MLDPMSPAYAVAQMIADELDREGAEYLRRSETPSARAARERREAAERARRYRERRSDRESERERGLLAREEAVARRESELDLTAHDTLIVDAVRVLLRDPGLREAIRTDEGMRAARLSLHALCGEALIALTRDVGMERAEAVRILNERLFRNK